MRGARRFLDDLQAADQAKAALAKLPRATVDAAYRENKLPTD